MSINCSTQSQIRHGTVTYEKYGALRHGLLSEPSCSTHSTEHYLKLSQNSQWSFLKCHYKEHYLKLSQNSQWSFLKCHYNGHGSARASRTNKKSITKRESEPLMAQIERQQSVTELLTCKTYQCLARRL